MDEGVVFEYICQEESGRDAADGTKRGTKARQPEKGLYPSLSVCRNKIQKKICSLLPSSLVPGQLHRRPQPARGLGAGLPQPLPLPGPLRRAQRPGRLHVTTLNNEAWRLAQCWSRVVTGSGVQTPCDLTKRRGEERGGRREKRQERLT